MHMVLFQIPMAESDGPFEKIDAVSEKNDIFVDSATFSLDSAAASDSAFAHLCIFIVTLLSKHTVWG